MAQYAYREHDFMRLLHSTKQRERQHTSGMKKILHESHASPIHLEINCTEIKVGEINLWPASGDLHSLRHTLHGLDLPEDKLAKIEEILEDLK